MANVSELCTSRPANRLLAGLTTSDLARLQPHLRPVVLMLGKDLERPNRPIDSVYFMDAGIASVVAVQPDSTKVEVGLIGREGMSGTAVALGADRSPHSTYMQVAGHGQRIASAQFRTSMNESATLRTMVLKYVHAFMVQTAHTAIVNARAHIDRRLARWILMAHDRTSADIVPLTHEFLALMLGVRRASVTEALQALKRRKLIGTRRHQIIVLDRPGIVQLAGSSYGVPEREYQRLIG
jgi:CRP-like cAMP-binding protein